MEERRISSGNSCILVRDNSLLEGWKSSVYAWLKEEGFVSWGQKGVYPGVDWMYINLTSKIFAPGMPGIPITSVIGSHAITLDEFKTIYHIFKNYEGLDPLRMSKAEQDEWNKMQAESAEQKRAYWSDMTFDKYCSEVREIMIKNYTDIPEEEVPKYLEEEVNTLKYKYSLQYSPAQAAYSLFMAWQ